jgi:hypothetical protein
VASARRSWRAAAALVVLGAGGCVGQPLQGAGTSPQAPLPPATLCGGANWTALYALGIQDGGPVSLLEANGNLYFPLDQPPSIMSLPLSGGTPTVVTALTTLTAAWQIWLAGDAIDFAIDSDKVWQVPLSGGSAMLVANGMTAYTPPSYAVPGALAVDGTYLYWDLTPQTGPPTWSLWRMPLIGGAAEHLADLPLPNPALNWRTLTPTAADLIVAFDDFNQVGAYAVPLAGGARRALPTPPAAGTDADNDLVGTSQTGILWMTDSENPGLDTDAYTMTLTDLTDPDATAVKPFWSSRPTSMIPQPLSAWPDGDGGSWIVAGSESFDDGAHHTSLWEVDAAGNGTRLGCAPNPDAYGSGIVTAVLPSPTAIYAVVGATNDQSSSFDYTIVSLSR